MNFYHFFAESKSLAFFIPNGAAFQILAAFLLKLSFSALDLASWFHSLLEDALKIPSYSWIPGLLGSSFMG